MVAAEHVEEPFVPLVALQRSHMIADAWCIRDWTSHTYGCSHIHARHLPAIGVIIGFVATPLICEDRIKAGWISAATAANAIAETASAIPAWCKTSMTICLNEKACRNQANSLVACVRLHCKLEGMTNIPATIANH